MCSATAELFHGVDLVVNLWVKIMSALLAETWHKNFPMHKISDMIQLLTCARSSVFRRLQWSNPIQFIPIFISYPSVLGPWDLIGVASVLRTNPTMTSSLCLRFPAKISPSLAKHAQNVWKSMVNPSPNHKLQHSRRFSRRLHINLRPRILPPQRELLSLRSPYVYQTLA